MKNRLFKALYALSFCCIIFFTGCIAVGPDYISPKMDMPTKWNEAGFINNSGSADISRWWTIFNDSYLNTLIERSMRSNKEIRLASARIKEARALQDKVYGGAYPSIGASGSYSHYQSKAEGKSEPKVDNLFQAGFDASWEIDIFGAVQRAMEASEALVDYAVENERDVMVTMAAETAKNYFEVKGNLVRENIAKDNIKARRQTVELTQGKYDAGLAAILEVSQAQAELSTALSQLPPLEALIKQGIYRIGVLIGETPESVYGELSNAISTTISLQNPPPEIPMIMPSDLLLRRPDIRRSERNLAAATAQVGIAVADLFPRFSLTGIIGQKSISLSDLAIAENTFWSVGPTIKLPIFRGGQIRANIRMQDAKQEQALIIYEQAVLNGLNDTENAITGYVKEYEKRNFLAKSVKENLIAVDAASELYKKGIVSFLNVLISQRSLYQAQDALAQSDQKILTNLTALFKALGGGWQLK